MARYTRPHYGSFRVNVGLYFAELGAGEAPELVKEWESHLRQTLGFLLSGEDTWWSLQHPAEQIAAEIAAYLPEAALPWLERFSDRAEFLRAWHDGEVDATAFTSPWDVALLHHERRERDAAEAIMREELRTTQDRGVAERTVSEARALGYDLSLDDALVANLLAKERRDLELG